MGGRPVWLASVSQWQHGRLVPTSRWGDGVRAAGLRVARRALGDVGDPTMERGFLMSATLCYHRGASDSEIDALPPGPGGLAGPPFDDVIYETADCPAPALSFRPCDRRTYRRLSAGVSLPVDDCGECPSCAARAAILGTSYE